MKKTLFLLVLTSFFIRIPFITWFTAERTDSIILITLFQNRTSFWPPLYTLFLHLFHPLFKDWIISGRWVSILSGSLAVIPLYLLARKTFHPTTALYASLLYLVSPLIFRFNLNVLTDSLFLLLFLSSFYFFLQSLQTESTFSLFWFPFLSGLATLTRYQGIIFLPFILFLLLRKESRKLPLLSGLVSWILVILWILHRGFAHISQYGERMAGMNLREFILWGECFILSFAYVITYPVFLFAIYTFFHPPLEKEKRIFLLLTLAIFLVWLPTHIFFHSFQLRYFLPLIPLFLVIAGEGIRMVKFSKYWFILCMLISVLLASLTLYFQKDSFGDIKRSAEWVRRNLSVPYVYSDEYWKTSFWSGKEVRPLKGKVKEGDILIIHSGYSNIKKVFNFLGQKYHYSILYSTQSRILPLLPDILSPPTLSNSPYWMILKYTPQTFSSFVIEIKEVKK
ncbi:glycosyltransferase family 39 protein [Candidatus Calescamantes bacterium]|nr:glycosyltransferase family 39 protein [Candidatus Calescamantes bacterium]